MSGFCGAGSFETGLASGCCTLGIAASLMLGVSGRGAGLGAGSPLAVFFLFLADRSSTGISFAAPGAM